MGVDIDLPLPEPPRRMAKDKGFDRLISLLKKEKEKTVDASEKEDFLGRKAELENEKAVFEQEKKLVEEKRA